MNLKSLDDLLDHVRTSANHLLLLSRHALERPWVLAELCEAHRTGKNIVVVLTEWGGNDDIGFRYPHDLERVIQEWSFFIANDPDHARAAQQIRDAFIAAGYTGILSSSPSEMVIFDAAVVGSARVEGEPVNLVAANHPIPDDVIYTPVKAGGTNVPCLDCGLHEHAVWDEHGVHAHVWSYASDRRGHWIWVQATCNRCGRVEVFRDTGGDASGYARDPRDYDRKHDTNHRLWSEAP